MSALRSARASKGKLPTLRRKSRPRPKNNAASTASEFYTKGAA
jgi:hypothetical protein